MYLLFFACLFISSITSNCVCESSRKLPGTRHAALFVFGDSLYDPGNNNHLAIPITDKANYRPYGETFFKFPTGRFSDGRVVPDFIAMYANLPLWTPFLDLRSHLYRNGANFASAGAGVLPKTSPGTIDLGTQLSYFKMVAHEWRQDLGDAEAEEMLMEAVSLSSIGGNDYVAFHSDQPNATKAEQQEFVRVVIGNLTKVTKEVYEIGGRKFAFQNVGPMGCLPSAIQDNQRSTGDGCVQKLQRTASLHNTALLNATQELQSQLPGFVYSIFDYYTTLYDRFQNPPGYGFKASEVACCNAGYKCGVPPFELCGDPNEFVFFDPSHPTEATNSQEAELFWNGEPPITIPYNMRKLFELKSAENHTTNLVDE